MSYSDVADLKSLLDIKTATQDTLLAKLRDAADVAIDQATHTTFGITSDTNIFHDSVADVDSLIDFLFLEQWLAAEPTTVTNGDGTVVTSDQYALESSDGPPFFGIVLLSSSGLSWLDKDNGDHQGAIAVLGKWAWSTAVPADITQASLAIAKAMYEGLNFESFLVDLTFKYQGGFLGAV